MTLLVKLELVSSSFVLFVVSFVSNFRASSPFCLASPVYRPLWCLSHVSWIADICLCFVKLRLCCRASFLFRWALSHLCELLFLFVTMCPCGSFGWHILFCLTLCSYSVYLWIVNVVQLPSYCIVRSSILYCLQCRFSYHWLIFFVNDHLNRIWNFIFFVNDHLYQIWFSSSMIIRIYLGADTLIFCWDCWGRLLLGGLYLWRDLLVIGAVSTCVTTSCFDFRVMSSRFHLVGPVL